MKRLFYSVPIVYTLVHVSNDNLLKHDECKAIPKPYDDFYLIVYFIILTDINECESNPCHPNATCTNTPGLFVCKCLPGFTGNGSTCIGMRL